MMKKITLEVEVDADYSRSVVLSLVTAMSEHDQPERYIITTETIEEETS